MGSKIKIFECSFHFGYLLISSPLLMKKVIPLIFLIAAVAVVLILRSTQGEPPVQKNTSGAKEPSQEASRDHGFNRRISYLEYTQHAKCRMNCRHISQSEVQEILQNGIINYRKSNSDARPCPVYALEGISSDNQRLRIVFAQCDNTTKVVTCIDLEKEWQCHCPGDNNKFDNRN